MSAKRSRALCARCCGAAARRARGARRRAAAPRQTPPPTPHFTLPHAEAVQRGAAEGPRAACGARLPDGSPRAQASPPEATPASTGRRAAAERGPSAAPPPNRHPQESRRVARKRTRTTDQRDAIFAGLTGAGPRISSRAASSNIPGTRSTPDASSLEDDEDPDEDEDV